MFIALIKMVIPVVIFCTIVIGIGHVREAATVGKAGGMALVYFIIMSTFALAIGLVVGNIIQPGRTSQHRSGRLPPPAPSSSNSEDRRPAASPDSSWTSSRPRSSRR
jgi:Na+/H+-dicarboxylate symporter